MSLHTDIGGGTKVIAGVLTVAFVAVLAHYVILFPYSSKSSELTFQQTQFSAVAQEVQQGLLKPDAQGAVTLPKDLASVTSNGKVYVTHRSGGLLLIYFPTWWGRNWVNHVVNYRGYVYCSRPLTSADKTSILADCDSVNLNGPSIEAYRRKSGSWPVVWSKWYLDSSIRPNWYSVMDGDDEL